MSEAATATTKVIKLMSKDDIEIEISVAAGKNAEFIKNALSLDDEEVDESKELTVDCKRVCSKTLESVVQFLTYYADTRMQDIPDPNKEVIAATFEEVVPQEWYRNYVEALGMDGMWRVRSAAHYMLIEPLTYLTNTWLAFYIIEGCKGKKNAEAIDWMHEILNIPKMTPEQEKKAREDYPWLYICLEEELPEPEEEEAAGAEGADDDDENDDDDDEDEEE